MPWPFRRNRGDRDTGRAETGAPAGTETEIQPSDTQDDAQPDPTAGDAAGAGAWRDLPNPMATLGRMPETLDTGFSRTLPTRWQVPPALAPLGHDVRPDVFGGLVSDVARTVRPRDTDPADLVWRTGTSTRARVVTRVLPNAAANTTYPQPTTAAAPGPDGEQGAPAQTGVAESPAPEGSAAESPASDINALNETVSDSPSLPDVITPSWVSQTRRALPAVVVPVEARDPRPVPADVTDGATAAPPDVGTDVRTEAAALDSPPSTSAQPGTPPAPVLREARPGRDLPGSAPVDAPAVPTVPTLPDSPTLPTAPTTTTTPTTTAITSAAPAIAEPQTLPDVTPQSQTSASTPPSSSSQELVTSPTVAAAGPAVPSMPAEPADAGDAVSDEGASGDGVSDTGAPDGAAPMMETPAPYTPDAPYAPPAADLPTDVADSPVTSTPDSLTDGFADGAAGAAPAMPSAAPLVSMTNIARTTTTINRLLPPSRPVTEPVGAPERIADGFAYGAVQAAAPGVASAGSFPSALMGALPQSVSGARRSVLPNSLDSAPSPLAALPSVPEAPVPPSSSQAAELADAGLSALQASAGSVAAATEAGAGAAWDAMSTLTNPNPPPPGSSAAPGASADASGTGPAAGPAPASAPASASASAPGLPTDPATLDLLARRLYGRFSRRLADELLAERERAQFLTDLA